MKGIKLQRKKHKLETVNMTMGTQLIKQSKPQISIISTSIHGLNSLIKMEIFSDWLTK